MNSALLRQADQTATPGFLIAGFATDRNYGTMKPFVRQDNWGDFLTEAFCARVATSHNWPVCSLSTIPLRERLPHAQDRLAFGQTVAGCAVSLADRIAVNPTFGGDDQHAFCDSQPAIGNR